MSLRNVKKEKINATNNSDHLRPPPLIPDNGNYFYFMLKVNLQFICDELRESS